jgi:hypothetical protein
MSLPQEVAIAEVVVKGNLTRKTRDRVHDIKAKPCHHAEKSGMRQHPRSGGLRSAEAHDKPMCGGICKLQLLAFQALTFAIFALFGYYVDE